MKKTLVALAAVSAVAAFAQTAYQPSGAVPNPAHNGFLITGGLDAGYQSLKYKGGNSDNTVGHNGTYTSQIDLVGVQDLGGGMKADFWYESDIIPTSQYNTGVATLNGIPATANTLGSATPQYANASSAQAASTWGNGQVKIGLMSSFGYIGIGAINNAALDFNQYSGPFGTAWGSGYGITQAAVGNGFGAAAKVRYDNSVRYLTPTMDGITGSLTYRPKNSTAANTVFSSTPGLQAQSGVQELSVIYSNGPLNAIFVNQIDDGAGIAGAPTAANTAASVLTTSGKYTTNSIGGNYTVGAATLYYGYQKMTDDGATQASNKTGRYAIKYALSPVLSVMAASNKRTYGKAGDATDGKSTSVIGLGADYMLSKTTALYVRMDKTQDDTTTGLASTQALASSTTNVVGAGFPGTATASDNSRSRSTLGLRITF